MRPVPLQTEEQVYASDPDFMQQPPQAVIDKGVKPLDTLPAAWWNWLWNQATKQDNNIFLDVNDIRQEMLSVLNSVGITPSASATNQLLQAVDKIRQAIATATIPGAVVSSSDIKSASVDATTGQLLINALSDWASEDTIKKALDDLRTAVEQGVAAEAKARLDADTSLQSSITNINSKIPNTASSTNKLVTATDLSAVNEAIDGQIRFVQEGLDNETQSRKIEDITLQGNINTLQGNIDTLTDKLTTASPTIGYQAVFGRDLLTVLGVTDIKAAAAKLKTNAGRGLVQPGDFLTITLSGIGTYRWEVAGVNHYRIFASGNSLSYDIGNVVFICSSLLPARRISPAGRLQYFGSEMDTYLKDTIAPLLEGALGTTLLTPLLMQSYNDGTYASPSWDWDPNDEIGDDAYPWSLAARKCFLPSIIELVGGEQFGSAYSNVGYGNARQFALMSMVPGKVDVTMDSIAAAWTRTPSRTPGFFYRLNQLGSTDYSGASTTYGVRPVFCL